MKIYIVDDDPLALTALRIQLEQDGYDVTAFGEPEKLVEYLPQADLPDLILTDYYMPIINGLDLLNRVRKEHPDLAVTILTSSRDLELTVNAINQGVYGFLLKPVVPEELNLMIRRLEIEVNLKRRVEEEHARLLHAQRLAEIGTLASGIAHEINNPNTFILGNVDILQKLWNRLLPHLDKEVSQEAREVIEFAKREMSAILDGVRNGSDRISKIVKSLALYSRQEGGHGNSCDLRGMVEQAQLILSNKLAEIDVNLIDHAPAARRIAASDIQLEQILINILSNAADAVSKSPDPRVEIHIRLEGESGVRIDVVDNGEGIPAEKFDLLLTPFYTTKKQSEGTGLGLYITQCLITKVGGRLEFNNNPDAGATFSVILPIAQSSPHHGSAA